MKKNRVTYDDNMLFLLSKAHWKMHKILNKQFRGINAGVTPDQWLIMLNIYNSGPMYQSQLSRSQFKDRAAIKRLLDQLLEKELIEKHRMDEDLRKKRIKLTEKGHQLVTELDRISMKTFESAVKDLTEDEINALKRLIQRLN